MSELDKIRYNGTDYNIGGASVNSEIIYNSDKLILKKCGNMMNLYTNRYIDKGVAEAFTIPEEYRGDGTGKQIVGMMYKSNEGTWKMRVVELFLDTGLVKIRDEKGVTTTDYTYVSFDFIWFI